MRPTLDSKLLVQFVAIAEAGSITQAATRLNVAQPWLSTRLQRLERQVGFALFQRRPQGLKLTVRGAELFDDAKMITRAIDVVERTVERLRSEDRQSLRLGAPPYSSDIARRTRLVDRFASSESSIGVEIHVGWTPALLERLGTQDLDLTFAMAPDVEAERTILIDQIGVDIWMRADDLLAGRSALLPDDLSGRQLYTFNRNLNRKLYDTIFGPLGQAGARLVQVADDTTPDALASEGAERALGTNYHLPARLAAAGKLVSVPLAGVRVPFMLVRRTGELSGPASRFWELAKAESAPMRS
ncbi:LysR family transcriptional regulator [Variovorax sp. J22P168]|uniref:LysR family transcriptional regulator n=1 Tax=Variovorax jilinensis TaxID=3053513 RepID=UPI002578F508|nr:LysR family transcriptional regulator [Variovorax sp. J22P168]MDM0014045.1 LysR family transcriptional regulator [Variovorax sp. J22P168]